ncbi:MAG: hypothetical protein RR744_00065 [Cellulosilyticaceae bacterium]
MFVDISELANDLDVIEKITILPLGSTTSNDYGEQSESSEKKIYVSCIVTEKQANVLDVKTGSYLPKVTYQFYIPTQTVYANKLKGATITRENGMELIVSSNPLVRKYVSHCVVEATEKRVVDDRK